MRVTCGSGKPATSLRLTCGPEWCPFQVPRSRVPTHIPSHVQHKTRRLANQNSVGRSCKYVRRACKTVSHSTSEVPVRICASTCTQAAGTENCVPYRDTTHEHAHVTNRQECHVLSGTKHSANTTSPLRRFTQTVDSVAAVDSCSRSRLAANRAAAGLHARCRDFVTVALQHEE